MFEPIAKEAPGKPETTRIVLSLIIVLAFVGFFVGIRQVAPTGIAAPDSIMAEDRHSHDDPSPAVSLTAIPATAYAQFDRRELGPNRARASALSQLKQTEPDLMSEYSDDPKREVNDDAQAAYLRARAQRRAFDGAPPVVPHPIDQISTTSCVVCHEKGKDIGKGVRAPMMPHPLYPNCTQCHAEGESAEFAYHPLTINHFQGAASVGAGSRAGEGAPPTIPHTTWMRENCLSCHNRQGASPIRTAHPWRTSCTQCHAPSAELDQVFFEAVSDFP